MSPAVHGGAGSMGFTALLNRGAVTPEFNFLHRGVIPPGAGIGHHFHNVVEEMFVILDGEAQFTDRRAHGHASRGPAGVICRAGHSHAIYNAGSTPVQWMNLNVSLIAGVYDAFDLGDTRAGAALDPVPTFMTMRLDRALLRAPGARGRGAAPRRRRPPSCRAARWARRCSRRHGPTSITCWCLPAPRRRSWRTRASARRITCSPAAGTLTVKGSTSRDGAGSHRRRDPDSDRRSRACSPTPARSRSSCS